MEEEIAKSSFARFVDRIREMNDRLSNVQKMAVSALIVALVLGVVLAIWFAHDREYGTLYTDLDEQQAGRITQELKNREVEYQITGGGTTIMVPSDKVYELRLALASTGITGGTNVGYELIDQNKFFGMPEDVIEVTKKRMLEGELALICCQHERSDRRSCSLGCAKENALRRRPTSTISLYHCPIGGALRSRAIKLKASSTWCLVPFQDSTQSMLRSLISAVRS